VRLLDVEQGTDEWLAARAGRITASNFGKVLASGPSGGGESKTRRSYMVQLLAERLTGLPTNSYANAAMQWGTEHEPQARAMYELLTGDDVVQVGMALLNDDVGASPDGLVRGDGGLEIKCPNTTTHIETILSGKMPPEHRPQVQGCMYVTGRDWWDFVSFDPRMPPERQMFVARVARDDEYIAKLAEAVQEFLRELNELHGRLA